LHGLHAFFAAQGLHGLHALFAAQGLHGLHALFAAQGLHAPQAFFAAQGLHGLQAFFAAHGLHFFAAQGLQETFWSAPGRRFAMGKSPEVLATPLAATPGVDVVATPPTTIPNPTNADAIVVDSNFDLNELT